MKTKVFLILLLCYRREAGYKFVCSCHKSVSDVFCRAQFIRRIRNDSIRVKLLQNPDQIFVEICEKAKTLEATKKKQRAQNSSKSEIHKIKQQSTKSKKIIDIKKVIDIRHLKSLSTSGT